MRLGRLLRRGRGGPSRARLASNRLIRLWGAEIEGRVLSIGSAEDEDGEGGFYRQYFPRAAAYLTSEVELTSRADLLLDVRDMHSLRRESFDCIFCSGVLEHVDDTRAAVSEMHRILKVDGSLLLGLPFRQAIHLAPNDFWRFTEYGVRALLKDAFSIEKLEAIDESEPGFPAAYWCLARRL